ncbi:PepSY domain-containing protein [Sphingomonas sp.]|uniref:PepSY domain-containing protein n=1 Tax=Sphingomonas sp. TaxID=28214 RepID=UPI003CC58D89
MKGLLLVIAITALASVEAEAALKGAALAGQAKVSLALARSKALRARPGRITDQELERERGGSGLRYSFDIASRGRTYEVGVDAVTGVVLENAREGAHPD